jgi:UDP-glucose 4-epimerase
LKGKPVEHERILLIGGAGFIGSALAAALIHRGHEVSVLDCFRQYSDPFTADYTAAMGYRAGLLSGARLLRGDACNPLDVLNAFETAIPDRVVHLAAIARAPLNEQLVAEAINTAVSSITITMQLAARNQVRRVLLISSSYVYGNFRYLPCDEDHPAEPTTVYGAAKLSAEAITRALSESLHVPATIARLIAVYGPWDLNGKLSVPNLHEAATTGCLPIAGTSGEGTDYTHIDDVTTGLILALGADEAAGQTINISRGRARTVSDIVETITALGYPVTAQPERVTGRPKRGALSNQRAHDLLGFTPSIDIEDGLADCLQHAIAPRNSPQPGRPISA